MNKKVSISKLLTASLLLCVYFNVLFTQFLCNYSHLAEHSAEANNHIDAHSHHHDHDVETPVADDHQHSDSKDDNCCKDKTAAFFAAQAAPANSTLAFKNILKGEFNIPDASIAYNVSIANSKGFVSSISPPPKIPDIRLFIQSFLI